MNLMFWKKKNGVAEEAGNSPENPGANAGSREPLDFSVARQGIAEDNQKPPEPELSGIEAINLKSTATSRLAARMKLWFYALKRHFQKPPEFRANEDHTQAESGDSNDHSEAAPEDEFEEEASVTKPVRSRKWLIIGGAACLLAGIVITNWPASDSSREVKPSEKHEKAGHTAAPHASQPEPAPDDYQTGIETLKRENAELQAQIEALKGEPPAAPRPLARKTPLSSIGGDMTVGNEDPNATAMTLKEAIEAMNAASEDDAKKPTK